MAQKNKKKRKNYNHYWTNNSQNKNDLGFTSVAHCPETVDSPNFRKAFIHTCVALGKTELVAGVMLMCWYKGFYGNYGKVKARER